MNDKPIKPNCYDCKFQGSIPGDAHSCCNHPFLEAKDPNPFGAMVEMLSDKFREAARELNIKGHPHGIKNGWFMWPANFAPIWLENCDGFKQKKGA